MKYCLGGAAFSGNKGASGMLTALIQNIRHNDPDAEFRVLSYYPRSDRRESHGDGIEILDGSPRAVVGNFFRSILYELHLPCGRDFRKITECDYFLDAAGITFVDGRVKFTIFNILTFLPALVAGIPVIKVSQAMGPFDSLPNRLLAKIFLPRLKTIVARGDRSAQYLRGLELTNVERFSDVAFSLECSEAEDCDAAALLPPADNKKLIGFSPSRVVFELCRKAGVDYLGELEKVVRTLAQEGFQCVIFPHSARSNTEKQHNNDLPLLRLFARRLDGVENLTIIDRELSAGVLRRLIARCELLVASRFHAIISAMATGVPATVIGWSHKYAEVLEPFELEDFVHSYTDFSAERTLKAVREIIRSREELSRKIQCTADAIEADNQRFFSRFRTNCS